MIAREGTLYKESQNWTNWRQFRVARKVRESDEITSFYLRPVDGKPLPSYKPGQYISVRVDVPRSKYPQARQNSLSDAPRSDYYRIGVKKESGLNPWAPCAKRHPGYVSNVSHDVTKATSLKVLTRVATSSCPVLKPPILLCSDLPVSALLH
jgi:nitric oxide dioxygenase